MTKSSLYSADPKYAVGDVRPDFILDPSLALDLPLYKLDGASLMSRDAYGHLCSVTGALWTPGGRDFDGVDDRMSIASGLTGLPPSATEITIEFWASPAEFRDNIFILAIPDDVANRLNIHFFFHDGNTYWDYGDVNATGRVSAIMDSSWLNKMAHWVFLSSPAGQAIYRNSAPIASDTTFSTFSRGTKTLTIAHWADPVPDVYWKGLIGEVRLYSRALTPLEIQHNYLATKWRYR